MNLGILADSYLKKFNLQDYDHVYGIIPAEGSSKFRLGRMDVAIDRNVYIIDDKKYIGYALGGCWPPLLALGGATV